MIKLSEHFGFGKLLRFTMPSIIMMIFTSIYGVVDGFFVSNFAGKTAFTALNFIMPFIMILGSVGFLFGTGGSALVAKIMGEGDRQRANDTFTFLLIAACVSSAILAVLGIIFLRPIASLLGAEGQMLDDCVIYARVILYALPAFALQYMFQCFFATAEKPKLGLVFTVLAGITNIVFDAVFVGALKMGLVGAALATDLGQVVGGVLPIVYFILPNKSSLRISKTRFDGRALIKSVTNGSSELMGSIAASLIGMLYNIQLLKYAGEDGIAAYGVLMYVNFVFQAIFIGYSVGVAPIVSYHYGAAV